jgi:hypothetical protein
MFPKKIFLFTFGLHHPKGISKSISEKEIQGTIFVVLIRKYNSPTQDYYCKFIIPFGNTFFPMMKAEWLHLELNYSTEYHNSGKNIIIIFCMYCI